MTIQENPHSKRNQGPNSFVKCDSKVAVLKNANNLKNSNKKKPVKVFIAVIIILVNILPVENVKTDHGYRVTRILSTFPGSAFFKGEKKFPFGLAITELILSPQTCL